MHIALPKKVGQPEVLARSFGRELMIQRYRHPEDGRVEDYSMLHAAVYPSITLPVTTERLIVAQWEFCYGIGRPVLTVSGGNIKGKSPGDVAAEELIQETGYTPGELILLNDEVFPDPPTLTFSQAFFLAKDCVRTGEPKPDRGEYIGVVLVPLGEWLKRIWSGSISDQKTIAITMLALPHLGFNWLA